jgi:hypothetical protein
MTSASNVAYIVFGFVSLVLLLLPSPWHWRVKNVGENLAAQSSGREKARLTDLPSAWYFKACYW